MGGLAAGLRSNTRATTRVNNAAAPSDAGFGAIFGRHARIISVWPLGRHCHGSFWLSLVDKCASFPVSSVCMACKPFIESFAAWAPEHEDNAH